MFLFYTKFTFWEAYLDTDKVLFQENSATEHSS